MAQDGFVLVSRESQITKKSHAAANTAPTRQHEGPHDHLAEIASFVDSQSEKLWHLNKFIHSNPEPAFQEFKAHEALTKFMRSRPERWQVTSSACGIETAWIAVYDSGRKGPAVSFNVEMGTSTSFGLASVLIMLTLVRCPPQSWSCLWSQPYRLCFPRWSTRDGPYHREALFGRKGLCLWHPRRRRVPRG